MRKLLLTLTLLLTAATLAFAQPGNGKRGDHRGGNSLYGQLDLTPVQQASIQKIRTDAVARTRALRGADGQRPDRAAVKAIREASQRDIETLLTPEQRTQLTQLREARKAELKAGRDNGDREALRTELRQYRKENIKPVLSAARTQLEAFISDEDKNTLGDLRRTMRTKPGRKRGAEKNKEATAAWKTEHAAELASLKALARKYEADIARIQERLSPQREQWRTEQRAIVAKYPAAGGAKAMGKKKGKGKKQQAGKQDGDWPKGTAFLLMKG